MGPRTAVYSQLMQPWRCAVLVMEAHLYEISAKPGQRGWSLKAGSTAILVNKTERNAVFFSKVLRRELL